MVCQVEYVFGQMSPVTPLSNQCIELEDSDVSADEEPGILPLTDNALREFENAMTRNDLDRLLGPTYAGIATNNDVSANAAGVAGKSDISKQQKQQPLRRINSLPTRQNRSTHKQPPVKKSRHTSETNAQQQHTTDENELESMIDEILKAMPNPSVSLKSNQSTLAEPTVRALTREEFEQSLNRDGGVSFREVGVEPISVKPLPNHNEATNATKSLHT